MDEKLKVDTYINLYKQQMDRFTKTQEIEWKGNFGVWALLAGAIYFSAKETINISRAWTLITLGLVTLVHLGWLLAIHRSQMADKKLWVRFRFKALEVLQTGNVTDADGGQDFHRPWYFELIWLAYEVGMTIILCMVLFGVLFWRAHPK